MNVGKVLPFLMIGSPLIVDVIRGLFGFAFVFLIERLIEIMDDGRKSSTFDVPGLDPAVAKLFGFLVHWELPILRSFRNASMERAGKEDSGERKTSAIVLL